jgi:DNA-binding NarL/FixJ family response regulator
MGENKGDTGPGSSAEAPSSRVVIADSSAEVRRSVRDALQSGGFVVAAGAADGTEALELITYYRPEVAVIDVDLPGVTGPELIVRLVEDAPEVSVLVFSDSDDEPTQLEAFRVGASGFVSKRWGPQAVANAARGILRGEAAVSRALAMKLVERLRVPEPGVGLRPVKSDLTPREWEVVDLVAEGQGTKEIAERLVLSEDTVYTHIKHILRKLDVHTRDEAVAAVNRMRAGGSGEPG